MMENVITSPAATTEVRRRTQWLLAPIMIVTVALGWRYPLLGFAVPVAMATGMIGGLFRGRYVCGNLCPRGSFIDRLLVKVGGERPIPALFRNMVFRWLVFAGLMGFMVWRLSQNPTSWEHWGLVFWSMCALTTGIAVIAGMIYHPRSWCSFCPVGTVQNAVGGHKQQLQIASDCRQCGKCEKVCSMNLPIHKHKSVGVVQERDCLRCSECVAACPSASLKWPEAA